MKPIALLFALFLPWFLSAQSPRQLDVGVIQSLTGIAAEDGKTVVQALQLAAAEINSQGEYKINLLIEDDQTEPAQAVAAFQRLAAQGVKFIVGATWDFTTNSILPLAAKNKVIVFNTSAIIEALNIKEAQGYGFGNAMPVRNDLRPFGSFVKAGGYKTAAIVYVANAWGETMAQEYDRQLKSAGASVLEVIKSEGFDQNEWKPVILKLKKLNPEITILALNKSDIEIWLRRAREIRFGPKFFTSQNLFDAFNRSREKDLFENVCATYPLERLNGEVQFRSKYHKQFGFWPNVYADNTYDLLFMLVRAHKAAGNEGVQLADVLRRTSYDGLTGHYSYSAERSFATGETSLVCVNSGKFNIIP